MELTFVLFLLLHMTMAIPLNEEGNCCNKLFLFSLHTYKKMYFVSVCVKCLICNISLFKVFLSLFCGPAIRMMLIQN